MSRRPAAEILEVGVENVEKAGFFCSMSREKSGGDLVMHCLRAVSEQGFECAQAAPPAFALRVESITSHPLPAFAGTRQRKARGLLEQDLLRLRGGPQ
jgi:hypothetical protein